MLTTVTCNSLQQHQRHQSATCLLNRGRGPARPPLRPLLVLVPPVGGDGSLRPGAGQQHLQETLSGAVSLHPNASHCPSVVIKPSKRCVGVQALPPVALILLQDELLPEACAGTDGVWRHPAAEHHAGRRQPKWDFRIDRQVGLTCGEGGASRGSPPLAGWLFVLRIGQFTSDAAEAYGLAILLKGKVCT